MAVTITDETYSTIKKVKFAWTSDGSGDASGTSTNSYSGDILGLVTVPGTGDDKPSDNYDLTITNADSVDVLNGSGANRDNTNPEYVQGTSLGWVTNSPLTATIAEAGATKSGTAYLYLR